MAGLAESGIPEHIRRNMKLAMYKRLEKSMPAHVVSMVTAKDIVFVGTLHFGCFVYRVNHDGIGKLCQIGQQPKLEKSRSSRATPTGGCSCYNIVAQGAYVAMFKIEESDGMWWLTVHKIKSVVQGEVTPLITMEVKGKAPMVLEPKFSQLIVAGQAWKSSWVSGDSSARDTDLGDERKVKILELKSLKIVTEWKAVENKVYKMKLQGNDKESLLGVCDARSGLKVFKLVDQINKEFPCLYHIPVEEIRTFEFAGDFVTVFHKFDYNISLWNMSEQKTILCINIQDQVKQIAEEYYEDDEDGLSEEEENFVSCVTCIPFEEEFLLIYGLKSGCILGVKVQSRTKVFSIPYPYESNETVAPKKEVVSIGYLSTGKIGCVYEKWGLTILDFTPENPPDRPPTRGNPQ